MMSTSPTSAVLIIGNEILSGRTQDTNLRFLANALSELGIPMREARVVPDVEEDVINAINALRTRYTYIFTTGGIGPTHDDITTACIAKAFGVPVLRHPDAEAALRRHYDADKLNAARLKMADVPEGAALIANPVSAAPGFRMGNVYVMAGVPAICQAMFAGIKGELQGGAPVLSRTVSAHVTEGMIAEKLSAIAASHPEVDIGSYPFMKDGKLGVSLVARGTDAAAVDTAAAAVEGMLREFTGDILKDV